ncbi:MAG: GNAT family N-acetyltransferase [Gaiellaceae bacterium MAG52_C11]|nr:GNAT family N-acetyltransferase [Candidatus Gaiellasilicea maunaloa]
MAAPLEIDWLPSSRIGDLQAFLEAEWRAEHVLARDAELLRWQHPRGDDELSFVAATERGELVGVLGVIPVEFGVRGDRLSGAWLTTWAVTPAARARRVGLQLLELALECHDFVGTIGGNATTMTILGALRFQTRSAVPRWIRPLDRTELAHFVGEIPDAPESPAGDGFTVREWRAADASDWNLYWEGTLASRLVGVCRDARYLEWRYLSHPRFDYRVEIAEAQTGEPAGLLVHRLERASGGEMTVLRIVDALGEGLAVAALALHVAERGRRIGAAFADFYCTSQHAARPLETAGFVAESALGLEFPSRFQPFEPGSRPLTAAFRLASQNTEQLTGSDVYFTRSDCDQDRPS